MTKGFFTTSKIQSDRPNMQSVAKCCLCGLYKHCKSPKMPPTGDGKKKILVVAEAPGENEDEQNIQLIGKAGKLVRRVLRSIDVSLDRDCWKTNAVICRRAGNKPPTDGMIYACRPNLMKAIKKYNPNVIILMGGVAMKSLLGLVYQKDIGNVARWGGYCIPCRELNCWIVPTFHPSYISREHDRVLDRLFKKHLKMGIDKAKSKPYEVIPDYKKEIEIIYRPSQVAKIIKEFIKKGGYASFDYETNCLKPEVDGSHIVSCSICHQGKRTISYPWQGESIDATSDFIRSPVKKIAANLKFEDRWTRTKLGHRVRSWFWCTQVNAHILDNSKGVTSLTYQAFVRLGVKPYDSHIKPFLQQQSKDNLFNRIHELDLDELLEYGGMDSRCEYGVAKKQIRLMRNYND